MLELTINVAAWILPLGLAALIFGLWGRRVGSDRICRSCNHTLSMTDELPERCPECGREVARTNAVLKGRRRRRWKLAILGAMLTSLGITGVSIKVYLARTQSPPQALLPVWWLRLDVESTSNARRDAALTELRRRFAAATLSDDGLALLMDIVLDKLADLKQPMETYWSDVLAAAVDVPELDDRAQRAMEAITKDVIERQRDPGFNWSFECGDRVTLAFRNGWMTRHEFLDFMIEGRRNTLELIALDAARTGTPLGAQIMRRLERTRVGRWSIATQQDNLGEIVEVISIEEGRINGTTVPVKAAGMLIYYDLIANTPPHIGTSMPLDAPIGHATMELDVVRTFYLVDSNRVTTDHRNGMPLDEDMLITRWTETHDAEFEIVPYDMPTVEFIDAAGLGEQLFKKLRGEDLHYRPAPTRHEDLLQDTQVFMTETLFSSRFRIPDVQLAHRVLATAGDEEWELGTLTRSAEESEYVILELKSPRADWEAEHESYTIELRADVDLAQEHGLDTIVGNNFKLENVRFVQSAPPVEDPPATFEVIDRTLTAIPHSVIITEGETALRLDLTIDQPQPGWGFDGSFQIGDREISAHRVRLFRTNPRAFSATAPITRQVIVELPDTISDDDLRTVNLVLRPMPSTEFEETLTLGPFDFTPYIMDRRKTPVE